MGWNIHSIMTKNWSTCIEYGIEIKLWQHSTLYVYSHLEFEVRGWQCVVKWRCTSGSRCAVTVKKCSNLVHISFILFKFTANSTWGDIFESSFKAQTLKLESLFYWNVAKETFELWALSFETVFENVTPSGISCNHVSYIIQWHMSTCVISDFSRNKSCILIFEFLLQKASSFKSLQFPWGYEDWSI